jgi:hypothetical protein
LAESAKEDAIQTVAALEELLLAQAVRVLGFDHGFCRVRVNTVGLRLLFGEASNGNLHSRGVPLSFTPLLRLKRCHACGQWHSSRAATFLPVGTVNVVHKHKRQNKTSWKQRMKAANHELRHTLLTGLKAEQDELEAENEAENAALLAVAEDETAAVHGWNVRCAFFSRNLPSRMPLDPTHVRLKRTRV